MKKLIRLLVWSVVFSLAGCGIKSQKTDLHDFGALPGTFNTAGQDSIDVEAPKWLADTKIRYRLLYVSPTRIRFYTLDRWIAPPSDLLEQRFRVVGSKLGYRIKIKLLEFEQQFETPGRAKALISFIATAYSTERKSKLGTKIFRLERLTATPDAKGAVKAFSELSRQSAEQIEIWISGLAKP